MKHKKILSASFWLIMAIHLVVFTAIGLISQSWRLLLIFLAGLAITLTVVRLIKTYKKRKINSNQNEPN